MAKTPRYQTLLVQVYPDEGSRFDQRLRISRRQDGMWRVSLAKHRKGRPTNSGVNLVAQHRSLDHAITSVFDQASGLFDTRATRYLGYVAGQFFDEQEDLRGRG